MIIPHVKKQLKCCNYNNQDEDTSLWIDQCIINNNNIDNSSCEETAEMLWL